MPRRATIERAVLLQPGTFAGIKTLMKGQENDRRWKQASFDLTAYRGMSLVLYIEVFNDSTGSTGRTWMYVDDVSVLACPKRPPAAGRDRYPFTDADTGGSPAARPSGRCAVADGRQRRRACPALVSSA